MNYPIRCNTSYFIVLLGIKNPGNIWLFITETQNWYGLITPVDPVLPIIEQILHTCNEIFENLTFNINLYINVDNNFSEKIILENHKDATLYLATIDDPHIYHKVKLKPNYSMITFPEFLNKMPKEKIRLPYLKAWQILMGLNKEQIKVINKNNIDC